MHSRVALVAIVLAPFIATAGVNGITWSAMSSSAAALHWSSRANRSDPRRRGAGVHDNL